MLKLRTPPSTPTTAPARKPRRKRCLRSWANVLKGGRPKEFNGPGLQCIPTPFLPGTPEKIEAMRNRYLACQMIFHDDDSRWPDHLAWSGYKDNFQNPHLLSVFTETCDGPEEREAA